MSARNRARQSRHVSSRHLRGSLRTNTNRLRLPNGMPLQERWDARNYYMGHRPGSRIRTQEQRFLQHGRQLSRRNPEQAALRLAISRNYDNTNLGNVLKARQGFTHAENIVQSPLHGNLGALGHPIAHATPLASSLPLHVPQGPLPESSLYEMWGPVARRSMRPMSVAELNKEQRFRQRTAEQAQSRGRDLYRSPRNISRKPRKVKSLSLKSKSRNLKKHSF
jgi:hypothetical protein